MNDAARNDREVGVPPEVLDQLKQLGGFGLQVPLEYEGVGLNNKQTTRFWDIIGGYDLGLGTMIGAHQVGGVNPAYFLLVVVMILSPRELGSKVFYCTERMHRKLNTFPK